MNEFTVKLVKKEYLTKDILILDFSKPAGFEFKAGQFVQFMVPNGEKPAVRAYSVSSAPSSKTLEFCVKILPDGLASQWFANMEDGAECTIRGPRGMFCADDENTPLYYVATGTGIAPVMSMLRDQLTVKNTSRQVNLLFGVRHDDDIFWNEQFDQIAEAQGNFTHTLTLSRPSEDWTGTSGRVTAHLGEIDMNGKYFLCGSAEMVKEVRSMLIEAGLDKKAIHFEIF